MSDVFVHRMGVMLGSKTKKKIQASKQSKRKSSKWQTILKRKSLLPSAEKCTVCMLCSFCFIKVFSVVLPFKSIGCPAQYRCSKKIRSTVKCACSVVALDLLKLIMFESNTGTPALFVA